jgi:hypothetical protein
MEAEEPVFGPKECGSCRWWRPILQDARGPIGPCRLSVRTGDFPGTAPRCERYIGRDEVVPTGIGTTSPPMRRPAATGPLVRHAFDTSVPAPEREIPEEILSMTREEFTESIREALREETVHVPLAPKWEGGTLLLRPRDPELQPKEIPLDQLFHKVVMIRDRLRVLEQKINTNEKLTDAEKVDIQSYVTRCYGSLTTFNILFRDERDRFIGERGTG